MATNQSFEDIVKILRSLRSVKGVVIQVKSELFGVDWARSSDCPQAKYNGVIAGWKRTGEELYVKSPGYSKNKAVRFEALENDSNGDSLELALQPYEDGSPPPELYVPPPPRQGEEGPGDLEDNVDEDGQAEDDEEEEESEEEEEESEEEEEEEEEEGEEEDDNAEQQQHENDKQAQQVVTEAGQVWRLRDPKFVASS